MPDITLEQDDNTTTNSSNSYTPSADLWIPVQDLIDFTGIKPQHLKLQKDDTDGLKTILDKWILQCQGLIKSYCHIKTIDPSEVNDALKNVDLRLSSNMVALSIARRDTPITQPNDWTVEILSSDIFTDDLKDDLEPYVVTAVTGKSDTVYVFTVKGDDPF